MENEINLVQFEQLTGIINQVISQAVKCKKIPSEFVRKTGNRRPVMIQPQGAAIAWLRNIHGTTGKTEGLRLKLETYINTFAPDEVQKYSSPIEIDENMGAEKIELETLNTNARFSEAQRIEKIYKAKLAELEFKQKQKTLILADEVYKSLFAFGRELRTEFEALPKKIKSKINSCNNDINLIIELIDIEIKDSLKKTITNLSEKELTDE